MSGEESSGTRKGADKWYGTKKGNQYLVFDGLDTNYAQIFDALKEGKDAGVGFVESKTPPDLREFLLKYGQYRLKQEFADDQYIRKLYALIPELNKSLNLILEKVAAFGLMTGLTYGNEDPCNFFKRLKGLDLPGKLPEVMEQISGSADSICSLKGNIILFLSERAREVMPNTCDLVGEEIAIELLYHSGSLRNLALMPASAIQVLGAEKALFKHILYGSPPPKHGSLFKVKGMSSLKTSERGRVARFIAGKTAIALRADFAGHLIDQEKSKARIQELLRRKK
ncbi:MAG: hypothetical protein M1129_02205 [Candidatus Thermoplasmatota archaeon]|jgi:nucleolar protein 56|nr:hypothetical protein [Candidatus Thermoplasmatota archaeon]MCL5955644.1 hypothetical protein [Candidatus Thermoplasmatota archaeon]